MATRKKKAVIDDNYSKLDQYAIELHEFYKSLRRAGFTTDNALWILSAKQAYPDWLQEKPTKQDILQHLEDEEEDD
jgi:hypothetical protein